MTRGYLKGRIPFTCKKTKSPWRKGLGKILPRRESWEISLILFNREPQNCKP